MGAQSHKLVLETAKSQGATLVPRLHRASHILKCAISELEVTQRRASRISKKLGSQEGIDPSILVDAVSAERLAALAAVSAQMAHTELRGADSMRSLAWALPPVISVIRAAGSQSHSVEPDASAMLCEAAAILGSIAVDAALIDGAQVRYDVCVGRSADIIERAKLIVDSKLSKSYPKLDLARLGSAWA